LRAGTREYFFRRHRRLLRLSRLGSYACEEDALGGLHHRGSAAGSKGAKAMVAACLSAAGQAATLNNRKSN
jgi:hypothetical protein